MPKKKETRKKLHELLSLWPKGMVVTSPWLKKQGVSRFLVNTYARSGWVRRVGRGAYARLDDAVDWTGALHAVQFQLGLPVHVGGRRALEMQGYGHFVRMREGGTVRLYGPKGTRLPAWFLRSSWNVTFRYTAADLFPTRMEAGLTSRPVGEYSIRLSSPERAMLEFLHEARISELFDDARLVMEGLTTLRAELVQELLEVCKSVKVKRLFLFLAEEAGHEWVKSLDVSRVGLGTGKRSIVKGGRFDPKYKITFPPKSEPAASDEAA